MLVLTEFRTNPQGLALVKKLSETGYPYSLFLNGYDKVSGVLAVSRTPIEQLPEVGISELPNRWLHFRTGPGNIEYLGIYLNGALIATETLAQKQAFWDAILASAGRMVDRRAIILGDLNTGAHLIDEERATFRCSKSFCAVSESGWIDAFRLLQGERMARSWWSTKRGFRLDHAFVSPGLASTVKSAEYVWRTPTLVLAHDAPRPWHHDWGKAISDHAALCVDLDV